MRCEACRKEIALAKVCPYCGHVQTQTASHDEEEPSSQKARGEFRGTLDDDGDGSGTRAGRRIQPSLDNVARFLFHPDIPISRKLVALAALFYVLSPIDILPGGILPVIGWLDDLAVMYFAWQWIARHLRAL